MSAGDRGDRSWREDAALYLLAQVLRHGGTSLRLRRSPNVDSGGLNSMHVRDGMSSMVLTVGSGHTLRHVSKLMTERRVGAAVVLDPDGAGPAIITERDILEALGRGQDPDTETVAQHLTPDLVAATPDWSL